MKRFLSLLPVLLIALTGCGAKTVASSPDVSPAAAEASLTPVPVTAVDLSWPFWEAYKKRFVSDDGRVIDVTFGGHSTSEGQSYGMFFSLVANDRETFDRMLNWTVNNLAAGDLSANLPAWKWGEKEPGQWGVIDQNAASDADLWISYVLLEAGRLWEEPKYTELGHGLLALIVEKEIADLPGLGPMLLPAPEGFQVSSNVWRLNPSYLPIPVLQGLRTHNAPGPWQKVIDSTVQMIRQTTPQGFIADWVAYRGNKGFAPDPVKGTVGSHDAIRCYLWAGMINDDSPEKGPVASQLTGMLSYWRKFGRLPEKINAWRNIPLDTTSPVGFLAVILPELQSAGSTDELNTLLTQIGMFANGNLYGKNPAYYDQNLLLFGKGFIEYRFRFGPDGLLKLKWKES